MGGKPKKQVIGYHYGCTLHMGVGLAADEIYKIIVGGKEAWRGSVKTNATVTINNPNLFGGEKAEGGIVGSLSVMMGAPDQPRNSLLVRLLGNLTPAFRGFVGLVFDGWLCAMNPYPKTWEIAYRRILAGWPDNNPWYPEKALITLANNQIHAMNPAHMLYESYISNTWGAGEARARMDDAAFKAAADTLYTEGFGLCIEWKVTDDLSKFRDTICDHIGARLDTHPLTGLITIRLIRDDYNLDELPVFTEDTGLLEVRFDSSNNTEVPSQVIVKYTDAITFEECSVMANNPAISQSQGGRSVETVEYLATPTGELATRLAYRDLKAKNSSLKRCTIKLDRRASGIVNGQPFRVKTLRRTNNIDIVVRAEKISEGFITDGTITMSCLQDVFGLPKIAFNPTPINPGPEQPLPPAAVTKRLLLEAPYREIVGVLDPANLQLIDNTSCFFATVADSPNNSCRSYNLLSRVKGASAFTDVADLGIWCPTATLATDIDYLTKTITLDDYSLLEDVEIGTAAIIDNEIVRIDGIDLVNKQLLIGRGCADTVPAKHNTGAVIWFYDGFETIDTTEYSTGLIVEAKLLSNTGTEQLEENAAPLETITMQGRQAKPYPPANVKINSLSYPALVDDYLTVSWVERNRLLQADQLIDTTVGDIAAEDNTTYNLRFITDNTIAHSVTGLTNKSYTWDTETGTQVDYVLMQFENNINDEAGNIWTPTGTPVYTDGIVQSNAIQFNSTNGLERLFLSSNANLNFGNNIDFTIECWFKINSNANNFGTILSNYITSWSGSQGRFLMAYGSSATTASMRNKLGFGGYNLGTGNNILLSTSLLTIGIWTHCAITRKGNLFTLYINGVAEATYTGAIVFNFSLNGTVIGRNSWDSGNSGKFMGELDQLRISRGCLYDGDFTPSTEPYTYNPGATLNKEVTIELEAVRDGLSSWQKHNITIQRS